jgi:hypothetical protein
MPDLAGPFDGSTFGQAPYYRDRGYLEPSGVRGPVAASAGAGDLGLTAAGFVLSLALGRAHVRGAAYERTGAAWTDTVPANTHATWARVDRVVLRRDLVAKTVTPVRVQGTAAATPTPPALTQVEDGVWELPLFRVTVPANSGTPLVIADERPWIDPATGDAVVTTATTPTGLYVGQYRDDPTAGLQRWDGTEWEAGGGAPDELGIGYGPGFQAFSTGGFQPLRVLRTARGQARAAGFFAATNTGGLSAGVEYNVGNAGLPAVAQEMAVGALWTGSGWSTCVTRVNTSGLLYFIPMVATGAGWNASLTGLAWRTSA